jgi:uncharacterized protein (TIGR00369 family)
MSSNEELFICNTASQISQMKTDESAKHLCYGCSKDNPFGLKLRFTIEEGIAKGEFTPGKYHEGWPGYTHGGILFTLLDEAGGYVVHNEGVSCVTAKSETKFIKQVKTGQTIQIQAQVIKRNRRLVEIESNLLNTDGFVIARNVSQWYILKNKED